MSRATRLANHIERTVTGPMWHGPALAEVLEGVTAGQAGKRAIAGTHTIWELVLHITAWAEIARQRVEGQGTGDPTAAQDWPPAPVSGSDLDLRSDPAWAAAVERLKEVHLQLAADARVLGEAQLNAKIPELDYTVHDLLHGIIEHGTYHGGQIALLKRAGGQS
jgi:uncharacterized damage-inducible protein DinB